MTKLTCLLINLLLCFGATNSYAQTWLWAKEGGGTAATNNIDVAYGVDTDASGNVFSCGTYQGTFSLGSFNYSSTLTNMWVGKQDVDGNWLWALSSPSLSGSQFLRAYSLKTDSNGDVIVAGAYASNGGTITMGTTTFPSAYTIGASNYNSTTGTHGFVMKLSGVDGTVIWRKLFQNANSAGVTTSFVEPQKVHVDASNNIYVAGRFQRNLVHNATNWISTLADKTDGFVVKLNSAGTYQWLNQISGNATAGQDNNKGCYGVTTDNSGNVYACGFGNSTTFVTGAQSAANAYTPNVKGFLAKWNSAGTAQYIRMVGTTLAGTDTYLYDMVHDGANALMAGYDSRHAKVYKYSTANGMYADLANTSSTIPSGVASAFYSIDLIPNTIDFYVTGFVAAGAHTVVVGNTLNPTTPNAIVARATNNASTCDFTWAMEYGSTSATLTNEYGRAISAIAGATEFLVAGAYADPLTLGSTNLTAEGNSDFYVARYGICYTPTITQEPLANASYCVGSITPPLSVTATGTARTYQWQQLTLPSTWNNIVGATNATYTPSTSGRYRVIVTACATSVTSAESNVTIHNAPSASITGTTTICNGASTTLTGNGGTSYLWSNTGTNTTITVNPTSNTTYTVTVTDVNTCTATASSTVTVNALPNAAISGTTTICNGGSTTLTASGGTGYAWSNSGTLAATTVSPITNTSYTVTVTGANTCTATASSTVTVNALPNAAISGNNAICTGNSTTLTASGGTYLWSNASTNAGINVSPTANTTYTVTVTGANTCTATASSTVTVNALPNAAISGTTTICTGSPTTLTASGGNTYAWSNSASGTAITVSPTANTTYIVTVTNANTCTATASSTVTVNPLPNAAAGGNATICSNGTATVSGASAANGTIAWTENGMGSITAGTTTLTPTYTAAAGDAGNNVTLTMTVTSNNACAPATATALYTVHVDALPTATAGGSTTICENGTAIVSGASAANGTIAWTENGMGAITNGANTLTPTYTAVVGDGGNAVILTMTVTSNNACGAATSTANYTLNVNPLPNVMIAGDLEICEGESTTLTASGANDYVWNGGANTPDNLVSPMANTTYTVTATISSTGCSNIGSANVLVNLLPTILITGTTTICEGASTTLTASGADGYVWNGGTATAAYTVSPMVNTIYTVTGTDALTGCVNTAAQEVVVNVLASIISQPQSQTICEGDNASFTVVGAGGSLLYQWQADEGAGFNNLSNTPPYTNVNAATLDITGADAAANGFIYRCLVSNGCLPDAVSNGEILTVYDAYEITNPQTICDGDAYMFNGNTYTTAGNYYDTLTTGNGCDSVIVTQLTVHTVDVGVNVTGDTLTASANGATYQWIDCNNGNAPILSETNAVFAPSVTGDYAVVITDGGCTDTSACVSVVIIVGNKEIDKNTDIQLYPNPNTGVFYLQYANNKSAAVRVEISNTLGQLMVQRPLMTTDIHLFDLTGVPAGMYWLRVVDGKNSYQQSFIIAD